MPSTVPFSLGYLAMSNFLRLVEEAAASVCWRNFNYGAFPPTGKPLPVVWKLELFKFMLIHFAECATCLLGCRWGCLHSVDLISLPPLPSFSFSFYSLLLERQKPRDTYHWHSQKSWTENPMENSHVQLSPIWSSFYRRWHSQNR